MAEKFLLTDKEIRHLVWGLIADELAFEKYGGAQKAIDDALVLLNKLTTDQINNIFRAASITGIKMVTFGAKPKRYDTLGIVRKLIRGNELHKKFDKDAEKPLVEKHLLEKWDTFKDLKNHLTKNQNKNDISEEEAQQLLTELFTLQEKLRNLGVTQTDIDSFIHFGKEMVFKNEYGEIKYRIKRN